MMSSVTPHGRKLRSACEDRCAAHGDKPCFVVEPGCDACMDCRRECGEDVDGDPLPLDPNAVVRPLI